MEWSTRTIEQRGLELVWKRYSTNTGAYRKATEEGKVFVPENLLLAIAERTEDDYLWDSMPFQVVTLDALALEQAGLGIREVRGGMHGTDKLRRFLGLLEPDRGGYASGTRQGKGVIRT